MAGPADQRPYHSGWLITVCIPPSLFCMCSTVDHRFTILNPSRTMITMLAQIVARFLCCCILYR